MIDGFCISRMSSNRGDMELPRWGEFKDSMSTPSTCGLKCCLQNKVRNYTVMGILTLGLTGVGKTSEDVGDRFPKSLG